MLARGERLQDSLAAEAVGMIWALAWILQSNHACVVEVRYDNCTVGHFVAGEAQWHASWEYTTLRSVLNSLCHCLWHSQYQVSFSYIKAHSGSPWNEAVDALAKATAKQIFPCVFQCESLRLFVILASGMYGWN